jgi:hypothetical protein
MPLDSISDISQSRKRSRRSTRFARVIRPDLFVARTDSHWIAPRQPSASSNNLGVFSAHPVYSGYRAVTAGVEFVDVSAPWSQVCSRKRDGYGVCVCACVFVCLCVCVCVCVSAVTVYHNGGRGSRSMPRNRGTLESRAHQQASACSDVPIRSGRRALSFANAHACSPMLSQGAFNPLPPRRPGRERERERGGRRQEAGRVGEEIYVAGCLKEDLTSVSRVSPVRFITRHFHDRFSHRFRNSIRTIVRPNWSARSPKDER